MICPFCKRLIHPDSYSCEFCGSFVRTRAPSPTPFEREEEDAAQRAGDEGEEWLLSVFGLYGKSRNVHRFAQKRIPAGDKRREIDLIAVTPKRVYVCEVKNWSGTLLLQGNSWVQVRRNGQRLTHPNALDANREKAQALLRYLKTKDIDLPDGHLSCKVFLKNDHLQIDEAIAQQSDVLYPLKLGYRINAETIIDYCLYQDAHDQAVSSSSDADLQTLFEGILGEIHQLRTWDRIYLRGQVSYKGDIQEMLIGNDVILRDDMRSGMTIEVHWSRDEDETRQMLYEMLDIKQGILVIDDMKVAVGNNDAVLFHRPGEERASPISVKKIEKIVIG